MNMKNFPKSLDSKTSYLRITVPENLDLALEGLIRKVLKEQPKTDDIYSFAANYFETLLKIRDKAGAKFTADQLCPFHNDEDAHEMIKIAGTFSKPNINELKKKNEEYLLSKTKNVARNEDSDNKVQYKKSIRKLKSKKVSKDEKTIAQNEQAISKINKKLPMTVKNELEEKKQTKLANKRSDDINLEKNTKKEESDDEEFLSSDPIKELVEKELMETKLNGKREEINKNTATDRPSDGLITNKNIQEQQKPAGNIYVQPAINNTIGPFEVKKTESKENFLEEDKVNKSRSEEIEENKVTKEKEIEIKNNITEQENEKGSTDVKEEKKEKNVDAEASNERPEDMEEENKENPKNRKKSNEESATGIKEINPKSTTNFKNVNKEETKNVEKTYKSEENTKEEKIVTDKTSDSETTEPKGKTTQEIQLEEKFNRHSTEMIKETTDKSLETINDVTEKDTNKVILSEMFDKDNTTDINCNAKEQEERNIGTPEEIQSNKITSDEKEFKELVNDPRVYNQIEIERETKSPVETTAKDENFESTAEDKKLEISVINIKSALTEPDAKGDVEKVEVNNNQELKAQGKKIIDDKAEPTTKIEVTGTRNPEEDEATKKTEELNNEVNATQTEQQSKVTKEVKETQVEETENKQYVPKNNEKYLETGESTENNKDENKIQKTEENSAKQLETKTTEEEIKTEETKLISEQVINTNENIVDVKPLSESTVSQIDSKSNFLKEKPNELSITDKKFCQSEDKKSENSSPKPLSDPTNQNEVIKSEKKENLTNECRVRITEDILFGEKTHDFAPSINNKSPQTPDEIVITPQTQKMKISEVQEDQQDVNPNTAESQITNKESITQEEENVQKLEEEDKVFTSLDLLSANEPGKEKLSEAIKSDTTDTGDTWSKDNKTESEKEPRAEESDNQKLYYKAEDESVQVNEDKREVEELCTKDDNYQTSKEDETYSEKLNEKLQSKYKFKTNNKNGDDLNPEEELCTVVDVQQISKEDAIDKNMLEEKYKPKVESTQNNDYKTKVEERTIEEENLHVITVEEADEAEENQEMSQSPAEIQIKTIKSHYYNTLEVPEIVTKKYRVHNVSSPSVGALRNAASSLQQSNEPKHELLNKEERIEKTDMKANSPSLVENVNNVLSSAKRTEADTSTEDINFDNLQPVDDLKNSKISTSPPANASKQNELEPDTQRSDSDDLQDLLTPTSGYSLNLSELSWQTINELFLDSEKRNSSLEKDENRYATPKTSKTTDESGEHRAIKIRQEVEEIIPDVVVSSSREAVPVPPRDLEANAQTSENVEEKKKDKPEEESASGSSSSSSNEHISVNDDTPFISVEVKTVIETQILDDDDDDENDHIRFKEPNSEEKIQTDMEIKVETTVDFRKEVGMTQSESESREDKMETTGTKRNGSKSSLETQDTTWLDKQKDSSSTEQTTGGEGSSVESDSTISSAATEIKRADFSKRNFSSTRSLLSTQSLGKEIKNLLGTCHTNVQGYHQTGNMQQQLKHAPFLADLEKKNPLMKTMSLSTFRHGVTDFEVWSTIEKELEEAATKIQSKFRGYKTRKKLQRENAVQITTEESSVSVTSVEAEIKNECQQSTGEFHDSIVLSEHPR